MLILTRMVGERVVINDNIVIEVKGIDRGVIRLGIDAPRDVPIVRAEILTRKDKGGETDLS